LDFLEAMLIRLLNRRDALLPADSLQAQSGRSSERQRPPSSW